MKKLLSILSILIFVTSCDDSGDGGNGDNFDRRSMLVNWADNIIIPAYQHYHSQLTDLNQSVTSFNQDPSEVGLIDMRADWRNAYLAWQSVAMFEIGQAEAIGLQGYTNTFPTDVEEIEVIISSGDYNLELPSRRNQQGLPALDYLLNGLADSDGEIVAIYQNEVDGQAHRTFLEDVSERLLTLTTQVVDDWNSEYRDQFVDNDGSSATGSVNKVTNDYIFYYEKWLRAAKVGIPAGVFSGTEGSDKVEAYYQNDISKELLEASLGSVVDFFRGGPTGMTGPSFETYLQYLETTNDGDPLDELILGQFDLIWEEIDELDESLANQVEEDNLQMLRTYDELQKNVVLIKVDMLQALNVRVDYVDADGD